MPLPHPKESCKLAPGPRLQAHVKSANTSKKVPGICTHSCKHVLKVAEAQALDRKLLVSDITVHEEIAVCFAY